MGGGAGEEMRPGPEHLRMVAVANALSIKDARAAIDREGFRSLLGLPPKGYGWDLARAYSCKRKPDGSYATVGVSSCGLIAAWLLDLVVRLPWSGCFYWKFPPPYAGLDIVSALSQLGLTTHSRRPKGERPLPGDPFCIGSGLQTHVGTCVSWDGDYMLSVDGGQVDDAAHGYLQRVKVCRRHWPSMRVVWVIDLERLAQACPRAEWSAADGWERVFEADPRRAG